MPDTSYPYPPELQRKILATFFQHPDFVLDYHDVADPEYFDVEYHQLLCRLLVTHLKKYGQAPDEDLYRTVALRQAEKFGWDDEQIREFKKEMRKVLTTKLARGDIEALKEEVINFARSQALRGALEMGAEVLQSQPEKAGSIERWVRDALWVGRNSRRSAGVDFFNAVDALERIVAVDSRFSSSNVVRTLIHGVDDLILGGLGAGEVGLVCGPPSRGKTSFLIHLGVAALYQGKNVFHFSLELKEAMTILRYASKLAGISRNELMKGAKSKSFKLAKKRIRKIYKRTGARLRIRYHSPGEMSLQEIHDILKMSSDDGVHPGLVIIDAMDDLAKKDASNLYGEGGQAMREMIALGDDFTVPIWASTQPVRGSMSEKTIDMHHLGESWQKAQKAHLVFTLNQTQEEAEEDVMRLFLAKVREGKGRITIPLRVDLAKCQFKEVRRPVITDEAQAESEANENLLGN